MRGYRALTRALFTSQLREPAAVFFLLIFSPGLLLVLGLIFGNQSIPEFGGQGPIDYMLPGVMVMSTLIIGTTVIPHNHTFMRSSGLLTRLRMTPLSAVTYLASDMTVNFVLGMVGPVTAFITRADFQGENTEQHGRTARSSHHVPGRDACFRLRTGGIAP